MENLNIKNLELLEKKFLCCHSLDSINLEDVFNFITWENQKIIMDVTVNHYLNKINPIKSSYQLSFLKKFIAFLETTNIKKQNSFEIHDEIYEYFCKLQALNNINEKFSFKHYLFPNKDCISLKECKSFVADGTTGLLTWQGAISLSNWILNNISIFENKNIIELGAGTGLCSFTIVKNCNFKTIVITDGSKKVFNLLEENLKINFKNYELIQTDTLNDQCMNSYSNLEKKQKIVNFLLAWENIIESKLQNLLCPDLIIAADVIYDISVFEALNKAITFLFNINEKCKLILAATVRNDETLNKFLKLIQDECTIKEENIDSNKKYLIWDCSTLIKIFIITKRQKIEDE